MKLKIVDRKFRGTNFIYTLRTPEKELIPVLVDSHHQHLHENNEEFGIKTPINIDHLVCLKKIITNPLHFFKKLLYFYG